MAELENDNAVNLDDPKSVYKSFKKDKVKNANYIIDIMQNLENKDVKIVKKAIVTIHKIFCQLIQDGDIKDMSKYGKCESPKEKFDKWLFERYIDLHKKLLKIMLDGMLPCTLQEIALVGAIKLIQKEAIYPINREKIRQYPFPVGRLTNFYSSILSSDELLFHLLKKLKEYLEMPDFLLASLYVLSKILSTHDLEEYSDTTSDNLVTIMELVKIPDEKDLIDSALFSSIPEGQTAKGKKVFSYSYEEARDYFSTIWDCLLKIDFCIPTHKRCLILLPERVMKHLKDPVRLTDYFLNAYNYGGVRSLLALHGVYILVTQYNLEYPGFYDKLYLLFDSSIFRKRYKARFFMLCNKFFLSPFLPEYVVAAFIKKCCRLMLTAPSSSLVLLLKFVVNLLVRFPSLRKLIHNPDCIDVENDPFIADEPRPVMCRASESSLWEVATLREHPLCGVSKAANFIIRNLPDVEHDLSKFFESSYEDMYSKACKIKEPRVATTFYKPEGLFKYSDDSMSESWEII